MSSSVLARDLFERNQVDSFDVKFEGLRWFLNDYNVILMLLVLQIFVVMIL